MKRGEKGSEPFSSAESSAAVGEFEKRALTPLAQKDMPEPESAKGKLYPAPFQDAIYQDMLELEGNGQIISPSTKAGTKEQGAN